MFQTLLRGGRRAARAAASSASAQVRWMGGGAAGPTSEARWAPLFPKAPDPTPQQAQKSLRKEMIGFLLLGPASAGLMVYDLIWGLENHEFHEIPPYPWMRIRRVPGMPWGENGLLEHKPLVATEWPPAPAEEEGGEEAEEE